MKQYTRYGEVKDGSIVLGYQFMVKISLKYEVIFKNEVFKEIKQVELLYTRDLVKVDENKIREFNVLTGVKYLDRNRKELFTCGNF
jgi:hypothetical protein